MHWIDPRTRDGREWGGDGRSTSLKSAHYFPFVSQTIGVEATTFLSRMQNFVKIGEELWT